MKRTRLKFFALGGVAGSILFTSVVLFCARERPDYNHASQLISELGATGTPNHLLMNYAGFISSGLMLGALGVSLLLLLAKRPAARIGSVFITLFGLGMVVMGIVSCDPGCPPEGSVEARIHDTVFGITFLSAVIGSLLLGVSFRRLRGWHSLWFYSVGSSLASFGFLVVLIDSVDFSTLTGLWQRLMMLTLFLWFGAVGVRLFRLSKD